MRGVRLNRRQFFGMSAAAVALAGLPSIVLPDRSIFLPPRRGWFQQIRMREIQQYCINTDSFPLRWDVAWEYVPSGGGQFYFILDSLPYPGVKAVPADQLEYFRDMARDHFKKIYEREQLWNSKQITLQLPGPSVEHAIYI